VSDLAVTDVHHNRGRRVVGGDCRTIHAIALFKELVVVLGGFGRDRSLPCHIWLRGAVAARALLTRTLLDRHLHSTSLSPTRRICLRFQFFCCDAL
jgi:hypothetical protein